ncbi:hypothetical protein ACFFNY_26895 [Paenibacillus hodogayensis]|uniref:Uncharacterized protein n=1 Tax=Paenibacillus hodogayensis TaxID=279208 RepID=A0ABV5W3S3_9BACL
MVTFVFVMLGCFVFFGAVIALIYRWIQNDTYAYDMSFIWDRHAVTLEQMEFQRKTTTQ